MKPESHVDEEPQSKEQGAASHASPDGLESPELDALRTDVGKFKDLALRAQADLENYRKRMIREKEEATRFANQNLLESLLPVLDNFELGLDAAQKAQDAKAIAEGMTMVLRQLQDVLKANQVEPIQADGAPFDPNLHEAVSQENSQEVPEGHIVRQVRKGYRLRDRLLRPASVVVSRGAP